LGLGIKLPVLPGEIFMMQMQPVVSGQHTLQHLFVPRLVAVARSENDKQKGLIDPEMIKVSEEGR